jgi:hypothetical protein
MSAIDTIKELAAAGITGTDEIAVELTKRGVEPPTTDGWTARDVSRRLTTLRGRCVAPRRLLKVGRIKGGASPRRCATRPQGQRLFAC